MTDEELVQFVRACPPGEVPPEVLHLLRQRLPVSSALRGELAAELHLEQYLSGGLWQGGVSVEQVLSRGAQQKAVARGRALRWGGLAAAGAALVALLYWQWQPALDQRELAAGADPSAEEAEAAAAATNEGGAEPSGTDVPMEVAQTTIDPLGHDLPAATAPPADDDVPAVAAPPSADDQPWLAGLNAVDDRPFEESCWDDFPPSGDSPDVLLHWLESIQGDRQPYRNRIYSGLRITGQQRLRSGWPRDSVLRLSAAEHHLLKLHLWAGTQGVTLQYFEHWGQAWAAFQTERTAGSVLPSRWFLAGVDEDRYRRMGRGTLTLCYQDGQVLLLRGDVILVAAPLAEHPDEVVLEGQAILRGLALSPARPLPREVEQPTGLLAGQPPAKLAWAGRLPGPANFTRDDDGTVALSAAAALTEPAYAGIAFAEPGLKELVIQIADATPGSGVWIGDAQGTPLYRLGFLRESNTGGLAVAIQPPWDERLEYPHDGAQSPAPLVGPNCWLKLVLSGGCLRCYLSSDGRTWSLPFDPARGVEHPASQRVAHDSVVYAAPQGASHFDTCATAGVWCKSAAGPAAIRLRRLEIRRWTALESLAPAELIALAPNLRDAPDAGSWLARAIAMQPPGAEGRAWRRACAVKTLQQWPSAALAWVVLTALVDDALDDDSLSLAARLAVLREAALVCDTGDHFQGEWFASRYDQLGWRLRTAGELRPYSAIRRARIESPVWSQYVLDAYPAPLIRAELQALVHARQFSDVQQCVRTVGYYLQRSHPDEWLGAVEQDLRNVLAWAEMFAGGERIALPGGPAVAPSQWRHPLLEQWGKEGYNLLAEFQAAIASEAYEDACRVIGGAGATEALGLLPAANDPQLLVSFPNAVALALQNRPALAETMRTQFGPLAEIRLRQAIAEQDLRTAQALTVQFHGTPAAAEARIWLGDQALAAGDFALAVGEYRQARNLLAADHASALQIDARLRLAEAFNGRNWGQPVAAAVRLGDAELPAAEFEALVTDLVARSGGSLSLGGTHLPGTPPAAPNPSSFTQRVVARWDGQPELGDLGGPYNEFDALARMTSLTPVAPRILLGTPFRLAAYDAASGGLQWNAPLSAYNANNRPQDWPLAPLRPLVAGGLVLTRYLTDAGPQLAALDLTTGQIRWQTTAAEAFVSDPLLVQDELLIVAATPAVEGVLQLSLVSLEPTTGEVQSRRPLVQMQHVAPRQLACQATVHEDVLLIATGGCTLCCDLLGVPRWLRKAPWLPVEADLRALDRRPQPPWVAAGRVFSAQPRTRTLECLDLASGQLLWQVTLPTLESVLGVAGETLLVAAGERVLGLAVDSGALRFSRSAPGLLEARLCGPPGGLLLVERERLAGDVWRPVLCWIDERTGALRARQPLTGYQGERSALGPAVWAGDRLWLLADVERNQAARDLLELTPSAALAELPGPPPTIEAAWLNHHSPALQTAAAALFPDWTLVRSGEDATTGLRPEHQGQLDVLSTLAQPNLPVRWARWVTPASAGPHVLTLQAAHLSGGAFKVEVRFAGSLLLSEALDAQSAGAWRTFTARLDSVPAEGGWLTVDQVALDAQTSYAAWKQLALVPGP